MSVQVVSRDRLRVGLVAATLLAVVLLTPRRPVLQDVLAPLEEMTARVTQALLEAGGLEVEREGAVLSHASGFAYEVYWRCTGLLPGVFVAGLILASPGSARDRGVGAAAGAAVVLVVNFVRLVHLFHLGVRHPAVFGWAHSVIWEAGIVLLVLAVWRGWVRWSTGRPGVLPA